MMLNTTHHPPPGLVKRFWQKHEHWFVSIGLGLLTALVSHLYATSGNFSLPAFARDIMLGVVITFLSESVNSVVAYRRELPKAVADAVNEAVNKAMPVIEERKTEIQSAVQQVIAQSIDLAFPHLTLAFDSSASDWLSLFTRIPTGATEGVKRAADRVNAAPRAVSCKVLALRVEEYADAAETLLGKAQKSVESTTYYPNQDFVKLLTDPSSDTSKDEDKRQVRDWIQKVNQWAIQHPAARVHRVHLFELPDTVMPCGQKSIVKCSHLQTAEQFTSLLEENTSAKTFYVHQFAFPSDPAKRRFFDAWQIPTKKPSAIGGQRLLPPECIVVDREVALMYDPRFGQLKMFFGKIAREMGTCFDNPDNQFTTSTIMQKYLEDKWKT